MALAGKNGKVLIGGAYHLYGTKWSIVDRVEEADLSCFELPYTSTFFPSSHDADITLEGFWEDRIYYDPPKLKAGQSVPLVIYPDYVNLSTRYFEFRKVFLSSVNCEAEVRGLIKISITAKNQSFPWLYTNRSPSDTNRTDGRY